MLKIRDGAAARHPTPSFFLVTLVNKVDQTTLFGRLKLTIFSPNGEPSSQIHHLCSGSRDAVKTRKPWGIYKNNKRYLCLQMWCHWRSTIIYIFFYIMWFHLWPHQDIPVICEFLPHSEHWILRLSSIQDNRELKNKLFVVVVCFKRSSNS